MRPSTQFLLLPLLIGMALIAALLAVTAQPVNAQWITRDQPPGTRQNAITDTLTLVITNATPVVNQPVYVTVTLANHAASQTVNAPLYTLQLKSEIETPTLLPERSQVQHDVTLAPGESDAALFTLYPISGGQITLTAQVTVTVHLSPPVQAQISLRAQPVTVTIPTPSPAASVIYETAANSVCADDPNSAFQVAAGEGWGAFSCAYAPGHSFSTRLDEANSTAAALAAFNTARGDYPLEPFHCHLAYAWSERPGGGPITDSGHGWTAGRWVNVSEAADDTPYGGAAAASESVYRTLSRRHLIAPCVPTYLPVAGR